MARRVSGRTGRGLAGGFPALVSATLTGALVLLSWSCVSSAQEGVTIDAAARAALDHISEDSLRGHLSFIASDALEGRGTPSRGLNLAAEYIAAQFRSAGLEPLSDGSYLQTVTMNQFAAEMGERGERFRTEFGGGQPDSQVTMSNVAGLLRGSDPELADTYIIVSAHYDHVGALGADGRRGPGQLPEVGEAESADAVSAADASAGPSDRIYNGANDDGSGTVSVIELASALASMPERPKRSILFLTFFGEERGLLGSRYYAAHPLVPVEQTIAQVNLEHMGRSDGDDGPHVGTANFTGFDFSDIPETFAAAGAALGVTITKDARASDPFFARSDNAPLAALGIPAHTMSVTYEFPEYHRPGDHWDKIDYPNMVLVDRALALGLLRLASSDDVPEWNASYPATARYVEAAKQLHGEISAPAVPPASK